MEANEHSVVRGSDVDLVAIGSQRKRCSIRLERVLVGEFGRSPMHNHLNTGSSLGHALMALGIAEILAPERCGNGNAGAEDETVKGGFAHWVLELLANRELMVLLGSQCSIRAL